MTESDGLSAAIQRALCEFDLREPQVEILDDSSHCTARISTPDGEFFLKLLAAENSETQLQSRMEFADFLRNGGLAIPGVVESRTGERFVRGSEGACERLAVLSRWIDGETLGDRTDDHWIDSFGRLLGRLHILSQEFSPTDCHALRRWDEIYAPAGEGWLPSFLACSPFNDEEKVVVERALARTRTIADRLTNDRTTYGLIHADFHGDNLIFDGRTIWIVDLDDVGWGHYLFDITWPAILFAKHHPDSGDFLPRFLRGYESVRPLSVAETRLLPEFLLAAGIGALEMIHTSPAANDSPIARAWYTFILDWLRTH